jgi:hypothetical protein
MNDPYNFVDVVYLRKILNRTLSPWVQARVVSDLAEGG